MVLFVFLVVVLSVHCVIFYVSEKKCALCEFYNKFKIFDYNDDYNEVENLYSNNKNCVKPQQNKNTGLNCDELGLNEFYLQNNLKMLDFLLKYEVGEKAFISNTKHLKLKKSFEQLKKEISVNVLISLRKMNQKK